jgi:hypothetical protein
VVKMLIIFINLKIVFVKLRQFEVSFIILEINNLH